MSPRRLHNRGWLAGRIAALALALVGLGPAAAGAVMVTGHEMIGWSAGWEQDEFRFTLEPLTSLEMGYRAWGEPETLEVLGERMLRDENWESWRRYQATTETRVPLAATQQFLESASRLNRLDKRLQVRLTRERPPFPEEEALERAFRLFNPQEQIGKVTAAPHERPSTGFKLFSFLLEDEGIFSGRAWSWDNFLPRIATISAIVLGGLLVVEFLRLVASLGIRRLVRRERKQG
ncbi:MAG: hypothetical protein LDL11_07465 [Desulfarculus sp.]|nr:hypothetical protein [Desulfarculus sp.]